MKFLFLTQYYAPEAGSPPARLPAIGKELQKLGHDVEVVTTLPNHPTGRIFPGYRRRFYVRETRNNIVVHRIWVYPAVGSGIGRVINYASFVLFSLYGLMRARRPDYIFVNLPPLSVSIPAMIFSRVRRVPMILHVADIWPDILSGIGKLKKGPILAFLHWLERTAYREAKFVNAVTEYDLRKLAAVKSIPRHKLLFLPNGVDTEVFRPIEYDQHLASSLGVLDKRVVLYAGSIGFIHNLDTALQAARILSDEPIRFVFVGGGSEKERTVRLAKELELRNVIFCDPVNPGDVARYYSISDAGLVLLKKSDALCGTIAAKIFPCMGCGKPVIFSGEGASADLIRNARAGVVVEPENPSGLAQAIQGLFETRDIAGELGRNGNEYIKSRLSWHSLVGTWLGGITRDGSKSLLTANQIQAPSGRQEWRTK